MSKQSPKTIPSLWSELSSKLNDLTNHLPLSKFVYNNSIYSSIQPKKIFKNCERHPMADLFDIFNKNSIITSIA